MIGEKVRAFEERKFSLGGLVKLEDHSTLLLTLIWTNSFCKIQ